MRESFAFLRLKPLLVLGSMVVAMALPSAAHSQSTLPPNAAPGSARTGVNVSQPNGYATIDADDMRLATSAGDVRWMRTWDGQEWKFQPQWESLSQSWKNLTGNQSADTTSGIAGSAAPGSGATSLSSGGAASGCWVWVDDDWQPSVGTAVIGGIPETAPLVPIRSTPFNRIMGDSGLDYPPPQRVSVDYAGLCAGSGTAGGSSFVETEGVRRLNELYLGEGGRYAFSNRSILEKRAVRQVPARASTTWYAQFPTGLVSLNLQELAKGFRWSDRAGDWIDYNTQGQVVAYGDRNNNAVWMLRDASGVLRGVADDRGRLLWSLHYSGDLLTEIRDYPARGIEGDLPSRHVQYRYDDRNRLVEVTDVRGHTTRYDYDAGNHIIRVTDPEGRVEQIAYSGDTVKQRISPDGGVTDYAFDYDDVNKQFISKVTGPDTTAGRRVEDFTYNRVGKLVRQIVNGRTETEVRYDTGARSESATNARGFTSRTVTDEFDQLVEMTHPDGAVIQRSFSAQHLRMVQQIDELGFTTRYDYDALGNLLKKVEALGTADERTTVYQRNALGQVTHLTRKGRVEANGSVTPDATWQFSYDDQGQINRSTDPEGSVRHYTFDRSGNLLSYTDPAGGMRRFEVDAQGQLIGESDPLGHQKRYDRDKVGNLVHETDALGKSRRSAFDAMNRLLRSVDPLGGEATLQYDAQGLPVAQTDPDGRVTRNDYDNFQRLSRQSDGKGNVTTHEYTIADGAVEGLLGSLGSPTQTRYPTFTEERRFDAAERLTRRTVLNPTAQGVEGLTETNKYDKRGQVVESTNADGKTSYFSYDAFGRATRFTNSLGETVTLTWDTRGNLIQVTDANGRKTQWQYDRANRLVKEILPLGHVSTFRYDAKGNRQSAVDPAGHRTQLSYDEADRLVRTEAFFADAQAPSLVYTFTYDDNDRLTGWSDGTRSATYAYDDAGRRTGATVNYGNNVSLSYSYGLTAAGLVARMTYPDATEVTYTYDSHGELGSMSIPGEGTISVNAWDWIAPKTLTFPGGTVRDMTHDGLLRTTHASVVSPGQQTVFELSSQFGKRDQITEKSLQDTSPRGSGVLTQSYRYDDEQRLTEVRRDVGGLNGVATETFGFDPAGNRIRHSQVNGALTYDANNRLVQRGSGADAITYHYDANGNLIRQAVGSSVNAALERHFDYDAFNRLVAVRDGNGQLIAEYEYDPFDLRLAKVLHRDETGAPLSAPQRTHYLYSEEGLVAEANARGQVSTQYGWKPGAQWGTDPVFIKTSMQGASDGPATMAYAYFHNDHLGTPLRATNSAGEVVWRADYASLGHATLAAENRLVSNLRFAGQYLDAETGLHYNTRRYYDPVAGRYITPDPLGSAGGWNLYDYANGDPANQLDPRGEWVWVVINVAMTVYDLYTEYKQYKETGCFDWTRFIPMPKWVPRIKWIPKRFRKCTNPCECMMGGGGGNSFTADTLVHVLDESGRPALKPISTLKVGDRVLARSEWKAADQALSYEPILDIISTPGQAQQWVDVTLEDGRTITATPGHPFSTVEGWRDAALLQPGSMLMVRGADASPPGMKVVAVQRRTAVGTTFNLEVANAHTYFVGEAGVLVHNGGKDIKDWKRLCKEWGVDPREYSDELHKWKKSNGIPNNNRDPSVIEEFLEETVGPRPPPGSRR